MTALEYKEFGKFKVTKPDVFKIFVKFSDFFQKPPFLPDILTSVFFLIFSDFSDFLTFSDLMAALYNNINN